MSHMSHVYLLTLDDPALELGSLARPGHQLRPGLRLNLRGNWKQNRIILSQQGYQYCPHINLTNLLCRVIFVSHEHVYISVDEEGGFP